jgi:hypothetical protein
MTKELFIECIQAIEQQMKYDMEIATNLGKVFPDAFKENLLPKNHFLQNALIHVLQVEMNDEVNGWSWIEYFLWETNFGKESYRLTASIDQKPIHLSTPEDLYDLLIGKPRFK